MCITISETAQYLLWFLTADRFPGANEDVLCALGEFLAALAERVERVLVASATDFLRLVELGLEGALGDALREVLSAYVARPGLFTWMSAFCADGGAVLHRVGELVEYFKVTIITDLCQTLVAVLQLALGVGMWWQLAMLLAAKRTAYRVFKSAWFTVLRTVVGQMGNQSANSGFSQAWQLRWGQRKVFDPSLVGGAAAVGAIGGGLGVALRPLSRFVAGLRSSAGWKNSVDVGTSSIHESLTEFVATGVLSGKASFSGMALMSGALGHGADVAGTRMRDGLYAPGTSFHVALARFQSLLHGGDGIGKGPTDSADSPIVDRKGLPSGAAGTDPRTGDARDHPARQRSSPEEAGKGGAPNRTGIPSLEKPPHPPNLANAPVPPDPAAASAAVSADSAPSGPSDGAAAPSGSGATAPDWSSINGGTGDSPALAESSPGDGELAPVSTSEPSDPGGGASTTSEPSEPSVPPASSSLTSPARDSAPVGFAGPVEHTAGGIILADQTLAPKELARELAYTRRALGAYAPRARARGTVPVVLHGLAGRGRLGEGDRSLAALVPRLAAELNRPEFAGLTVELVTCVTHGMPEGNAHATLREVAHGLGRDVVSAISPMWIVDAGRPEGAGLWLASEIGPDQRAQWPPNGRVFRYPKDGGPQQLIGTGFHDWTPDAVRNTDPADLVLRKWMAKGAVIPRQRVEALGERYALAVRVAGPGLGINGLRRLGKVLHALDRRRVVLGERAEPDEATKAAVSALEATSLRAHEAVWQAIAALGDVPVDYLTRHGAVGGPLAKVDDYQGMAALRQWVRDEAVRALPDLDSGVIREAVNKRLSDEALSGRTPGVSGVEALFDGSGIVLDLGKGPDAAVLTISARPPRTFRLRNDANGEPADKDSKLTKVGRTERRDGHTTTVSSSIGASAGYNSMTTGTPGDLFKAAISGSASVSGGIRTTRSQAYESGFQATTDVGVPALGDLPAQAHLWHGTPDGLTLTFATRAGVPTPEPKHAPPGVVAGQAITVRLLNALVFAAPQGKAAPTGNGVRLPAKATVVNFKLRAGLPDTVASLLPAGLGKPGGNARSIWAPEVSTARSASTPWRSPATGG